MTNFFNKEMSGLGTKIRFLTFALGLLLVQQASADNVLKDVKAVNQADGNTAITLQFAEPIGDIKAFSTDNPPRIAIDLPETSNALAQKKLLLTSGIARSVNTVEVGDRTRVVVELAKNAQYRTESKGNFLLLTIDGKPGMQNAVQVSAIDFKRGQNGSGQMVVRFDGSGAAPSIKESGTEIVLDIANAKLPAGPYRLSARAATRNVVAYAGNLGAGVGLRISGSRRTHKLEGTMDWTPLTFDFELAADEEVTVMLELRATKGEAWFDADSIKLERR